MTDTVRMLSDASCYSKNHMLQVSDCEYFMSEVVRRMEGKQEVLDTVMDIGCGPGDTCRWTFLPVFPNVKKMVAIDVLPDMIHYAKNNNAHEKIDYQVADIVDANTLETFFGTMSKVLSAYCFNWVKDQKRAFLNLYRLLKPGGEAAIMFLLSSNHFESFPEIISNPRWNGYLREIDPYIPESHFKKHRAPFYRSLLEDIGFDVSICQADDKCFTFPDDKTCAEECYPICSLSKGIPPEHEEEFKEEILRGVLKYNGRSTDGRPMFQYSTLSLLIKKPVQ